MRGVYSVCVAERIATACKAMLHRWPGWTGGNNACLGSIPYSHVSGRADCGLRGIRLPIAGVAGAGAALRSTFSKRAPRAPEPHERRAAPFPCTSGCTGGQRWVYAGGSPSRWRRVADGGYRRWSCRRCVVCKGEAGGTAECISIRGTSPRQSTTDMDCHRAGRSWRLATRGSCSVMALPGSSARAVRRARALLRADPHPGRRG